jgi:hypothetical protein
LKLAVEKAALDLDRSLLNLDEVKASGQAPRDELYAPVLGGRDFVSERMELERKGLELDVEGLQRPLKRFEQLVENGLVERDQLDALQAEIAVRKGRSKKSRTALSSGSGSSPGRLRRRRSRSEAGSPSPRMIFAKPGRGWTP